MSAEASLSPGRCDGRPGAFWAASVGCAARVPAPGDPSGVREIAVVLSETTFDPFGMWSDTL